jgi:hypothetical protein
MVDRDNRDDWRRERSLLALGRVMRGDDSTVSIGDRANSSWREDAAAHHRAARSEREARLKPQPDDAASFRPPPASPAAPSQVSAAAPPPAQPITPPQGPADDAVRLGLFGSLTSALRYFVRREPAETVDMDSAPPESVWRAPDWEGRYIGAATTAPENFRPPPASPAAPPLVAAAALAPAQSVTPPPVPANDTGRPGLFRSLASAVRYFVRREAAETVDWDSVPPESVWRAPDREERYLGGQPSALENVRPPYEQGYSYSYRPDHAWAEPYEDHHRAPPAADHPQFPASGEVRQPVADHQGEIDEIRASLREFREAVRELTESRSRRRYF